MIRMVVFDMAGTTVNENNAVYKTLQKSINEHGYDFTLETVLESGAGREKLQAINYLLKSYMGVENKILSDMIYQRFVALLSETYEHLDIRPLPNALELFRILRRENVLVVLNTGYSSETALSLIAKLGWSQGVEFDLMVTAGDVKNSRPDPDMILFAMEKFGILNAHEVMKVGDTTIDIEEGRNAGCALNIAVTTGAHCLEQLQGANPDYIINDLMELVPIISSLSVNH